MKKIFKLFLILGVTTLFVFSLYAWQIYDIETKLKPYNLAVDKVNKELGTKFVIPRGKEFEIFHDIQNMTPEELAKSIKEQFLDVAGNREKTIIYQTNTSQTFMPNYDTDSWKKDY